MKVGLFFGSFNPIHIGHLILANHILEFSNLNEIWFVVSPQNPFKEKKTLLNDYQRLHIARLAIEHYPNFKVSDIEFNLQKPSYTIDSLAYLKEKYPNHEFTLILGEDNLHSLPKWKNSEKLISEYQLIIYPRLGNYTNENVVEHSNIQRIEAPIIEISSTMIRQMIKENKNVRPLLTAEVFDFIDGSNLYKY
jgi:nicotinate-nucleotide adenylyltransferase